MAEQPIYASRAISFGWTSVKKDFWYFIAISVVVLLLSSFSSFTKERNVLVTLVSLVLSAWMTGGQTTLMLSYQAGKKLPFEDLFKQTKLILPLLGASLLLGLIVGLGMFLFIIPGIYFALKYQFTNQLIVDKKLGILEAMQESGRLTQGKKMSLLGFDFMCIFVMLLGLLALGVGVFVAAPVVSLAMTDVYRKLVAAPATPTAPVAA